MQQIPLRLSAQEQARTKSPFPVFLFAHLTFTNHFTDLFFPQVHYLQERSGLKWSIEENQEITSRDGIEYKGSERNRTE